MPAPEKHFSLRGRPFWKPRHLSPINANITLPNPVKFNLTDKEDRPDRATVSLKVVSKKPQNSNRARL
jgi:hypothetical protein